MFGSFKRISFVPQSQPFTLKKKEKKKKPQSTVLKQRTKPHLEASYYK